MHLLKMVRLIWTFYRSFLLSCIIITVCCLSLFWKYGLSIFTSLFWFKAATLALTYYFINSYKSKEYYYYLNLGVSRHLLWIAALGFDFALFLFLIIQTYKFK